MIIVVIILAQLIYVILITFSTWTPCRSSRM